jgi:4'-phosphopantetheinyl transferase
MVGIYLFWMHTGPTAGLQGANWALSDDERQRAEAIQDDGHRAEYVAARGFVRACLGWLTGFAPASLSFAASATGKPEMVFPHARRVRFNVAKTWGLVVCAAAAHREVGVDVEHCARPVQALAVARRHFAPDESEALAALQEPERTRCFLRLWVLKEAQAKGAGVGLAQPLCVPRFTIDRGRVVACADDSRSQWRFRLLAPTPDHVLALAVSSTERDPCPKLHSFLLAGERGFVPMRRRPILVSARRSSWL